MLSQKRGYKVNFIYKYLGRVVDIKKIIQTITNRLIDNKEPTKFRLFYYITITDTCLLSRKKGYKVSFISTSLGLIVEAK